MILQTYKQSNSLPMARRYVELNGIKSLSVSRYDFAENPRKPWRIWESKNAVECDGGWPCGQFRTKREALIVARELSAWIGLLIV